MSAVYEVTTGTLFAMILWIPNKEWRNCIVSVKSSLGLGPDEEEKDISDLSRGVFLLSLRFAQIIHQQGKMDGSSNNHQPALALAPGP
jgi:hypothetical protein